MGVTFAARSHRDNVAWPIPTSFDSDVADLRFGPVIFAIIFSLNFAEYGMGSRPFAPPEIVDQVTRQLPWHRGRSIHATKASATNPSRVAS